MTRCQSGRRTFLGALAAAPFAVFAQRPAARRLRVACLAYGSDQLVANLLDRIGAGLKVAGLPTVEIRVFRAAAEDATSMGRVAAEAVAWAPDAIFAPGPLLTFAAREATRVIPIVFFAVPDPDTLGVVASLPRPGGNATGSAGDATALVLKRLELAREVLPLARRVVALYRHRPGAPSVLLERINRELAAASAGYGMKLDPTPVGDRGLAATLAAIERARPDAIVPFGPYAWEPDGRPVDAGVVFRDFERRTRIVVVAEGPHEVRQGVMLAMYDGGSQLAAGIGLLAKVLKGSSPADLPVELPREYRVAVNLGAARAIGVTLPPSVMIRADLVVE